MALIYVTKLFRETGSVKTIPGSCTLIKRTLEAVENDRQVMDDNPHTYLKRAFEVS